MLFFTTSINSKDENIWLGNSLYNYSNHNHIAIYSIMKSGDIRNIHLFVTEKDWTWFYIKLFDFGNSINVIAYIAPAIYSLNKCWICEKGMSRRKVFAKTLRMCSWGFSQLYTSWLCCQNLLYIKIVIWPFEQLNIHGPNIYVF